MSYLRTYFWILRHINHHTTHFIWQRITRNSLRFRLIFFRLAFVTGTRRLRRTGATVDQFPRRNDKWRSGSTRDVMTLRGGRTTGQAVPREEKVTSRRAETRLGFVFLRWFTRRIKMRIMGKYDTGTAEGAAYQYRPCCRVWPVAWTLNSCIHLQCCSLADQSSRHFKSLTLPKRLLACSFL